MRVCSKNPSHRHLGATRCEVPGCGALIREVPDEKHDAAIIEETKPPEPEPAKPEPPKPEQDEPEPEPRDDPGKQALPPILVAWAVFKHQSGSKVGQAEQFRVDAAAELTLGRDPQSTITFDSLRDDIVSRHHATIRVVPGPPPKFAIADVGSRNGTFLNGALIVSEEDLLPGDVIKLGPSGPSLLFGIDVRPAGELAAENLKWAIIEGDNLNSAEHDHALDIGAMSIPGDRSGIASIALGQREWTGGRRW